MKISLHVSTVAFAATMAAATPGWTQGLGAPGSTVEVHMIANEAFANQWAEQMVPEFQKAYPHINEVIDGVPYTELLAKSMLDATGPDPIYDIIIADDPWVPQLAQTGVLMDLKGDQVAGWTSPQFDWNDFYAAPLAASEWQGVQYGVPLRSNLLLMFVNKALYEKAGLPAPTADHT